MQALERDEADDFVIIDPIRWLVASATRDGDALLDRNRGRVLNVVRIFGDQLVEWVQLPRGADAHIGGATDALQAPIGSARQALVEGDWSGWTLAVDASWDTTLVGATEEPLGVWLSDGRARLCPDGRVRARLPDDVHAVVRIGLVTFVVHSGWPARAVVGPEASDADPTLANAASILGLVAVLVGFGFARTSNAPSLTAEDAVPRSIDVLLREGDWRDAPTVEFLSPKPAAGRKAGPGQSEDRAHRGGAALAPPPSDAALVEHAGLLGALRDENLLQALLASPSIDVDSIGEGHATRTQLGVATPWASRGTGGTLEGGGTARSAGELGFGDRGIGGLRNGGSLPLSWQRPTPQQIAQPQDPIVMGALDRALIDGPVKSRLAQIRYCYQRVLVKLPELGGKVVVKFVIAKDGSVSSAVIKSSTLNNREVEDCIVQRFLRFQFPEPKGGGIVIVHYPFLFAPG